MNRRAFLFASAAAACAPGVASGASDIRVIYVGGADCPPCVQWKKTRQAGWMASPEYRQVDWVEIDPAKFREAYQARYWPGDLRPVLDQLPRKSGAPRFLIVRDGRVVSNEFGLSRWEVTVTELKKLLGE